MGIDGYGTSYDVSQAIYYAIGQENASSILVTTPAKVINMSLGSSSGSSAEYNAIVAAYEAGVTVVVASGNDNGPVSYPAVYPEVIAVGAVGTDSTKASYSNFGPQLDLVAPGGDMVSSHRQGVFSLLSSMQSNYFYYGFNQGTSMACPHATGAAALLLSISPTLSPDQLRNYLYFTALDLGVEGFDNSYGYGLIDILKANLAVLLSTINFDSSTLYMVLLNTNGEIAYQYIISGANTSFSFKNIIPGNYTLLISTDFNKNQIIGEIYELSTTFQNVQIKPDQETVLSPLTLNLLTTSPSQYIQIASN
jgi:serine protease